MRSPPPYSLWSFAISSTKAFSYSEPALTSPPVALHTKTKNSYILFIVQIGNSFINFSKCHIYRTSIKKTTKIYQKETNKIFYVQLTTNWLKKVFTVILPSTRGWSPGKVSELGPYELIVTKRKWLLKSCTQHPNHLFAYDLFMSLEQATTEVREKRACERSSLLTA